MCAQKKEEKQIDASNSQAKSSLMTKIFQLKEKHQVTILAHYYQPLDVQQIADYIGDSLGLAKQTINNQDAKFILFAGVHFMAETASILNQSKTVLSPDPTAGCPLASFLSKSTIEKYKEQYPGVPLIVYVNTTAETKALADVCCTSSNALKMVKKTAEYWHTNTLLFGPDRNLAEYIRQKTDFNIITIPSEGNCPVHNQFSVRDVILAKEAHPQASLIVHPESPIEVQKKADFVGSTTQMIDFTINNPNNHGFIIGTENGLISHLKWKNPSNQYYPLCSNAICKNMKKNSLDKVYQTLLSIEHGNYDKFEVRVDPEIARRAKIPVDRMMEFSL